MASGQTVRVPHLYRVVRRFCLGAFAYLYRETYEGTPLGFAFEEHAAPGRPALYEYRPLVRSYAEARSAKLARLGDARVAVEELAREPGAAVYARAHGRRSRSKKEEMLFRAVLLPLLIEVAEGCGGFEWDDVVFDRGYLSLERSLFEQTHSFAAVAPLVGLSAPLSVELAVGLRVRQAATGELAAYWPEANGLLPPGFGQEPERACVLELEYALEAGTTKLPDAPGEIADAVTALRLATSAPVAAGPVLFEILDRRPLGVRPALPIAAAEPPGEPSRLDSFRGRLAREVLERLATVDGDPELAEALDRWELALFTAEPFRSEQLREAFARLLAGQDGPWAAAARVAVLLGESATVRGELFGRLRGLVAGGPASPDDLDMLRSALVEVLMHGERLRLINQLDDSLLGLSLRPRSYFAVREVVSAS